jgi:hypothetical protein
MLRHSLNLKEIDENQQEFNHKEENILYTKM